MALLAGCMAAPMLERPELSVMSFNIRYGTARDGRNSWTVRKSIALEVVRLHGPDIVGMQEVLPAQRAAFVAAFPEYAAFGLGRQPENRGEQSCILYRTDRLVMLDGGTFWLSETPEVPGSKSWDSSLPRICTWMRLATLEGGSKFYVFNTHFDHRGAHARFQGARLIMRRIQERLYPDPVILTGDLNADEQSPPVVAMADLKDTFRLIHPDRTDVRTFHAFRGETYGDKIDYVFVSPGLEVLDAQILRDHKDGRYPSDHYPVTARVRLP